MNIRQMLECHDSLIKLIETKEEELETFKNLATEISSNHGTDGRKKSKFVDKYIEIEKEIVAEVEKLFEAKLVTEKLVDTIPDYVLRNVLIRLYIIGETTETTAEKIGYSARNIARLKEKAINYLESQNPNFDFNFD